MGILTTVIAFIVALGVLIVVHEFGHYIVARWCGVKVLRFSVGFGQPLLVRRLGPDQTEWAVAAFPLGGYVKMLDEREGSVAPHERERAFNRKPVHKRIAIVAAGPIANFLLAIALYWALFVYGVPGMKAVVAEPAEGTAAAKAQLIAGDTITAVAGQPVSTWQDVRWVLLQGAVDKGTIALEVATSNGEVVARTIDLSALSANDLDSDFLDKIGLARFEPVAPVLSTVAPSSQGERAGLRVGDRVLSVDGRPIEYFSDFVRIVRASPDRPLKLVIERNRVELEIPVTPAAAQENGRSVGKLGVGATGDAKALEPYMTTVRYGPVTALGEALAKTWEISVLSLKMLGKMIVGQVSLKNLSGPLTIADYAGQTAQMGWLPYVSFIALISISLGVLNLLPVPVLDGGHLMYYIVEIIKGRPVSERTLEIGQRVGMVLLFTLMAFAIYNDIHRLVGG